MHLTKHFSTKAAFKPRLEGFLRLEEVLWFKICAATRLAQILGKCTEERLKNSLTCQNRESRGRICKESLLDLEQIGIEAQNELILSLNKQ